MNRLSRKLKLTKKELERILTIVKGDQAEISTLQEFLENTILKMRSTARKDKFHKIYSELNEVLTNSYIDSLPKDELQEISILLEDISERTKDARSRIVDR